MTLISMLMGSSSPIELRVTVPVTSRGEDLRHGRMGAHTVGTGTACGSSMVARRGREAAAIVFARLPAARSLDRAGGSVRERAICGAAPVAAHEKSRKVPFTLPLGARVCSSVREEEGGPRGTLRRMRPPYVENCSRL